MYSKNELIARKSSYEQNESFKKEGKELHMIRIIIHKCCVKAAGTKWKRDHQVPKDITVFDKELEALITNAVDLSNWATIENYDPIGDGF